MKPETIKRLQENIPELTELIAFLATEAEKLNTLSGIDPKAGVEVAVEVIARLRAYETVTAMLAPLVGQVDRVLGADPKEYVV